MKKGVELKHAYVKTLNKPNVSKYYSIKRATRSEDLKKNNF